MRWVERTYARQERPLRFRADTVEQWRTWREHLRAKLVELSGLQPPPEGCDLVPRLVERVDLPEHGLIREKVRYQSEPDVWVSAYLLRPLRPRAARLPAILALHGHALGGRWGKETVAGATDVHEQVQRNVAHFNYDYGLRFARRGYVVLCPDALVWGERAGGYWSPTEPLRGGTDPCDRAGNKAALLGYSLLSLVTWDNRRAIDYLQSRPDVDPERIGAVGLSYGGTQVYYLAALEERVQAAVISGCFASFWRYALDKTCCNMQVIPGIVRWAELPDIVGLIAPRPLLIEAGIQDTSFPIDSNREAYEAIARVYRLLGVEKRLWRDEFDDVHRWSGRLAYEFMDRYLGDSALLQS